VQRANVKINETQLASARVVDAAPLQPTRASYVSSSAKPAPRTAQPPVPFSQRKVVAKLPPPMPPESHSAPRVVSAEAPPAARPNATIETNRAELPDRPQATASSTSPAAAAAAAAQQRAAQPQTYKPEVFEEQNPPSAHENQTQTNARGNSYNGQPQRGANDNRPPSEQQQHPAVRYTPPTRANDQMYDVHPPLKEQQQQQQQSRPAQQERASPPPQQKSTPPPASSSAKPH
jgi:DNA polymerase-3 subunit gamma/tau